MSHIYWELNEIPIPESAHINHGNGRVFLSIRGKDNRRGQLVIGHATSESTMHANDNFKFYYPELWKKHYGGQNASQPHELHAGLYGLFLSVGHRTGLYPLLQKLWGPVSANAAMDYAMFSTRERTVATYLMSDFEANQVLFSEKRYGDAWYSEFFGEKLTEDQIHQFRIQWLEQCVKNGNDRVWICVDGSNNDCHVQNSNLAERGASKSHKAVDICSYIWAVSAKDGRPITWFVNNGGKTDFKSFEKIEKFLADSNISIEGFILDRGFASEDILKEIREHGYRYVVMLKSNAFAYQELFTKFATQIRWQVPYLLNRDGLFGITERTQIFKTGQEQACVGLYFNPAVCTHKAMEFITTVFDAYSQIEAELEKGVPAAKITIPTAVRKYITLTTDSNGISTVKFSEEMQLAIDGKGYSAIACSDDFSARKISEIYDYRDVSEKQFSILKSQLGADVTRVHDDQRIEAKLAVCFIAAIIRTEIELACRRLRLATNKMLREVDRTVLALMPSGKYCAIHDMSERVCQLYAQFGLTTEHLDFFADDVNSRQDPIHGQLRALPPFAPVVKRGPGRPRKTPAPTQETQPKRRPGRPKGSKNKATLEREAREALMPAPEKRRPGRPKGSKNKKTLEREALANAPKRGRGRPKGSKNRKTLAREAEQLSETKS